MIARENPVPPVRQQIEELGYELLSHKRLKIKLKPSDLKSHIAQASNWEKHLFSLKELYKLF